MRVLKAALVSFAAVLLAWQLAVTLLQPPPFMLPSPWRVAQTLAERRAMLASHGLLTLGEIALGLVAGVAAGILAGFSTVAWPAWGRLAWPVLLVLQALPVFALAPILVLWFGFGLLSKVVMVTLILFFPVASAFADGLRRTDPELLDATALTEASHLDALLHVRVPLALPALVSGIRVAAPLAPLGAVIGEWVGASGGLGFVMIQANARMQTDLVFAAVILLAAVTLALRILVDRFAPLLAPWAAESAGPLVAARSPSL